MACMPNGTPTTHGWRQFDTVSHEQFLDDIDGTMQCLQSCMMSKPFRNSRSPKHYFSKGRQHTRLVSFIQCLYVMQAGNEAGRRRTAVSRQVGTIGELDRMSRPCSAPLQQTSCFSRAPACLFHVIVVRWLLSRHRAHCARPASHPPRCARACRTGGQYKRRSSWRSAACRQPPWPCYTSCEACRYVCACVSGNSEAGRGGMPTPLLPASHPHGVCHTHPVYLCRTRLAG